MDSPASKSAPATSLPSADRLRIYRKCFHDLEEQLVQLLEDGYGLDDPELVAVQTEVQCLEELIMLFTDITSMVPSIGSKLPGDQWDPQYVDGLNLSLVTDILMLSATSPWTVYVAERSQWQICYASPSLRRLVGWKPSELLGSSAWDGCHPEDIAVMQRMLLLREASSASVYRRMRKDRSYVAVHATGRAVGNRWYAWVEQEVKNTDDLRAALQGNVRILESATELLLPLSKTPVKSKAGDMETSPVSRPRKVSSSRPTLEADANRIWGNNAPRPASPLSTLSGLPSRPRSGKGLDSDQGDMDVTDGTDDKVGSQSDSYQAAPRKGKEELGVIPSKPKALQSHAFEVLQGKKILLVEDDRVNRTIAQKLLENLKCSVTVACNGKEALDILKSAPPVSPDHIAEEKEIPPQFDLVLMDLLMPVMDGTKAVLHFRDWEAEQEPPRKKLTIFALTSNVSDGDMVKCAISGFDEFVSKPLTIDKLLERLQKK